MAAVANVSESGLKGTENPSVAQISPTITPHADGMSAHATLDGRWNDSETASALNINIEVETHMSITIAIRWYMQSEDMPPSQLQRRCHEFLGACNRLKFYVGVGSTLLRMGSQWPHLHAQLVNIGVAAPLLMS